MRLALFNKGRLGIVDGDDLVDVTEQLTGTSTPSAAGALHQHIETVARDGAVQIDLTGCARVPLDEAALEAPLPRPGKVVGAPVNYLDHKAEMAYTTSVADLGVFLKANSSVIGPGQDIVLPYTDKRTDQEGELGVVIGRTASNVDATDALDHVFGYTCVLDITVRSGEDRSTRKSFDTFTPIGPWIVTADEIPDPGSLDLRCDVGGATRQRTNTADLIFGVAELIAYTSSVMTLHPGDVIATGTPAGVGPLSHGDRVVLEIDRVGRLEVGVDGSRATPYEQRPGRRDR
ncbi:MULTISPECIES: fumarylacetoacetate hydrolase family protein [Streptomyces]|uniref:fumarylacetoacetate hydrolase family protein n=1 Tax=Streptomyces TaxID=1883 RepID=UPI0029A3EC2B|nr:MULTISPECIES: fumarylacetoacetate hydrolase family protein [Streptomyces]MDX3063948.1 fumarylacetoacetate hydrolase family protein [Streptomyces sp. ND04-05B]WRY85561.1 fumarylacetoacetate hydrolase family protein [Streptomyces clavifer]WUC31266.1 fumarylacetoacetate hydrolase family protein [Streptomyces clavifer]